MKRLPIYIGLLLLALIFVLDVTADDSAWPDFNTQATEELWWFYDSTGTIITSVTEFRAYVVGVGDTTDANNYVDSVLDTTCDCHVFVPERTSRFRIVRKDDGSGTGNESVVIVGAKAPKNWVDTEAIQDNAIGDPQIGTNALGDRHVPDGGFSGNKITDATLPGTKLVGDSLTVGSTLTAADSQKVSLRVSDGWIQYAGLFPITFASSDSDQRFLVPGCLVGDFVTVIRLNAGATPPLGVMAAEVETDGEVRVRTELTSFSTTSLGLIIFRP